MKKKLDDFTYIRLIALIVALFCTVFTVSMRFYWESRDKDVLAVMSPEDIALLAESSGTAAPEWAALFGDWDSFSFAPFDGDPVLPLALVENHERTSMHMPEGFDVSEYSSYGMVKALYLYDDYANRVVGSDPQEVENLLFRAVTDRGMRLLILTPFFTTDGQPVTDIAVYRDCLEGLAARIEARGYTFGEDFSCLRNQKSNWQTISGCGLLTLFAGIWLLCRLPLAKKYEKPLLFMALAGLLALSILAPDLTRRVLMLAAAVVFPCIAAYCLAEYTRKTDTAPLWQSILVSLALVAGWSLLGGLNVAALMTTGQYMLGVSIFSGVKIALLLPMAFCCALLLWNLRKALLGTGLRSWLGLGFAAAAIAAVYLLLTARSGDLPGGISGLETALRNFLEYTLYARPRTKELLFAVPCIPVFLWACRKKLAPLQLLCGAGVCLECVSVINTFCHAVAPLQVSVTRTLLSVCFGLLPGLLATGLLQLLFRKKEH